MKEEEGKLSQFKVKFLYSLFSSLPLPASWQSSHLVFTYKITIQLLFCCVLFHWTTLGGRSLLTISTHTGGRAKRKLTWNDSENGNIIGEIEDRRATHTGAMKFVCCCRENSTFSISNLIFLLFFMGLVHGKLSGNVVRFQFHRCARHMCQAITWSKFSLWISSSVHCWNCCLLTPSIRSHFQCRQEGRRWLGCRSSVGVEVSEKWEMEIEWQACWGRRSENGQTTTKGYQEFNFQVLNNIIATLPTVESSKYLRGRHKLPWLNLSRLREE